MSDRRHAWRLTYPLKGWAEFRGDVTTLPPSLRDELALVPGIGVSEQSIAVPWTAYDLPAAEALAVNAGDHILQRPGFSFHDHIKLARPLYEHQKAAVASFLQADGCLLLGDPMGLGKTAAAIAAVEEVVAVTTGVESRPRLIIAPLFTRSVWKRELEALGVLTDDRGWCALQGKDVNAPGVWNPQAKWIFCHYDVLWSWWDKLARLRPVAAIVDEIHECRNPKTKRAQAALTAASACIYRIGLTGTLLVNKPAELYMPLTIVGGNRSWGSSHAFRTRYCGLYHDGWGYRDGAPTHVDELKTRLQSVYLRRELNQVAQSLPALVRQPIEVDMPDDARTEHDAKLAQSGLSVQAILDALLYGKASTRTFELIAALRKITARVKISTTVDYAQSVLAQGEPIVIFAWERAVAQKIGQCVGLANKSYATVERGRGVNYAGGAWVITGDLSQSERDVVIDVWRRSPPKALVATIDSLGMGVSLQESRFVLLHDLHWTPAKILQAEARCRRLTSPCAVQSVWVIARDSIDTILARVLLRKADYLENVLDQPEALGALDDVKLSEIAGVKSFEDEVRDMLGRWGG